MFDLNRYECLYFMLSTVIIVKQKNDLFLLGVGGDGGIKNIVVSTDI